MNDKCVMDVNYACCQHVEIHDDEEVVVRNGKEERIRHLYQTFPPGKHYLFGATILVPGPSDYLVP